MDVVHWFQQWVQITDECGDTLERDKNVKLLKNIHHSFERDNIKRRECHVGSHISIFKSMTRYLSVCVDPTCQPLILIGQDKLVFKQYTFGRRCWHGPNGETKLLPKMMNIL